VLLSFKVWDRKTQYRQGLREFPGTGVFVISACIGESAKKTQDASHNIKFFFDCAIVCVKAIDGHIAEMNISKEELE
jgi:hypothetical protein